MTVKFIESGTTATQDLSFYSTVVGGVSSVLSPASPITGWVVKVAPLGSNSTAQFVVGAMASGRCNFYYYCTTAPSGATSDVMRIAGGPSINGAGLSMTTGGVLGITTAGGAAITGGTGSKNVADSTWHRICLVWSITSSTVYTMSLFIDGALEVTVSNSTTLTSGSTAYVGNGSGTTFYVGYYTHIYVDDSSSLTDTGNVRVVNSRPWANGSSNNFDTEVGSGGSDAFVPGTGGTGASMGGAGDTGKGQLFYTNAGGNCLSLTVRMFKFGSPTDNVFADIALTPTGTALCTSNSIPGSSISSGAGSVTFTFPTPAFLTPGTLYVWRVRRDGSSDSSNNYAIVIADSGYSGITFYYPSGTLQSFIYMGFNLITDARPALVAEAPVNTSDAWEASANASSVLAENFLLQGNLSTNSILAKCAWIYAAKGTSTATSASTNVSGSGGGNGGSTGTTCATSSLTASVGDTVIVVFADQVGGSTPTIADGGGNTYTLLSGPTSNGSVRLTKWYTTCNVASPGVITVTFASSAASRVVLAQRFISAGAVDVNVTNSTGSTSPYNAPTSGTLAQASELVFGAFAIGGPSSDPISAGGSETGMATAGSPYSLTRVGSVSAQKAGGSAATTLVTSAITTNVGDLVVFCGADQIGTGTFVVSDSKANTVNTLNATTNTVRMTPGYIVVASGKNGSTTYTATFSSSKLARALVVTVFRGFTATPKDVNPANATFSAASATIPATGTLAQAGELLIGFLATSTVAESASANDGTDAVGTGTSSTDANAAITYHTYTQTAAYTMFVPSASSTTGIGGVASFKASNLATAEVSVALTYRVVSSTSAVAPSISSTINRTGVLGTASVRAYAAGASSPQLTDNGVDNALTLTTTPALYTVLTTTNSFPANQAGIGMKGTGGAPETFFYEGGMLIAYVPAFAKTVNINQAVNRAGTY